MPWAKLDDRFYLNPKIMQAGLEGRALYIAGLVHCAGGMTDGIIERDIVPRIALLADVIDWQVAAERLVRLGLWVPNGLGYTIHNWLQYNPSAEHTEQVRQARAEAGKRGGRPPKQTDGNQIESKLVSQRKTPDPTRPVPIPTRPIPDQGTEETPPNPPAPTAKPPAPVKVAASPAAKGLVTALCEELGADESALTPSYRKKQTAIASRIVKDGVDEDSVRRLLRYLQSQRWRTAPIDLHTVEAEMGKWRLAGCPVAEAAPARASPNHHKGPPGDELGRVLDTFTNDLKEYNRANGHQPGRVDFQDADAPPHPRLLSGGDAR